MFFVISEFNKLQQFERVVSKSLSQEKTLISLIRAKCSFILHIVMKNKQKKGIRWMPWHRKAMKDVTGCDKPRVAANKL